MKATAIREELEKITARRQRSAWARGVNAYAFELCDDLAELGDLDANASGHDKLAAMLNGARDWDAYSYGGSSIVSDYYICARLCSPSEQRKANYGARNPNCRETWLDVQARALYQASRLVLRAWCTAAAIES